MNARRKQTKASTWPSASMPKPSSKDIIMALIFSSPGNLIGPITKPCSTRRNGPNTKSTGKRARSSRFTRPSSQTPSPIYASAFSSSMNPPTHSCAMTSTAPCRHPEAVRLKSDVRGDQARMMGVRVCPAPGSKFGRRRSGPGKHERGGQATDELVGCRRSRQRRGRRKRQGPPGD